MGGPILVTGGAGYIGSHVVRRLGERGAEVITLDDLSTGYREAVLHGDLIIGDVGDWSLVNELIKRRGVRTVMHFAARTRVLESVNHPLSFYQANTCATRNLLQATADNGVSHFILSSSASVYGNPTHSLVSEEVPPAPINPYGTSKLVGEWMLRDLAVAGGPRFLALRYFNVAGSDPQGRLGNSHPHSLHLIKVVCQVALGRREAVPVFGTNLPTPDGTGVRDYVHVEDIASAHLRALDHLEAGGESDVLNVGYGHGYSVREVLTEAERVTGRTIPVQELQPRSGDPPALVARTERIRERLGWRPSNDDLEAIIRGALEWEKTL